MIQNRNARHDRQLGLNPMKTLKAATLEQEFEASMQAIMAAAIAVDAFYAIIQNHLQLPSSLIAVWKSKRTPRYAQITELLRRAFLLEAKKASVLRRIFYPLRDLPVHPSGKVDRPIL